MACVSGIDSFDAGEVEVCLADRTPSCGGVSVPLCSAGWSDSEDEEEEEECHFRSVRKNCVPTISPSRLLLLLRRLPSFFV